MKGFRGLGGVVPIVAVVPTLARGNPQLTTLIAQIPPINGLVMDHTSMNYSHREFWENLHPVTEKGKVPVAFQVT